MSCSECVVLIKKESRVAQMKSGLFSTPGITCLKLIMDVSVDQ